MQKRAVEKQSKEFIKKEEKKSVTLNIILLCVSCDKSFSKEKKMIKMLAFSENKTFCDQKYPKF